MGDFNGRYHLRRVSGDGRTIPHNYILLDDLTRFGRNPESVDVVLTSAVYSNMISRDHAKIIGQVNSRGYFEGYVICDKSLNGTYINDKRVKDMMKLKENDIIKFGHMNGAAIKAGTIAPQANAEFTFTFERANPSLTYLGCDPSGRREMTMTCNGDGQPLQIGALRSLPQLPDMAAQTMTPGMPPLVNASPTLSLPMGYPSLMLNYLAQQQQAQNAQLRAPDLNMLSEQYRQALANQALFNRPLFNIPPMDMTGRPPLMAPNPVSTPIVQPTPPLSEPSSNNEGRRVLGEASSSGRGPSMASPPMECDSSVPSPPKTVPRARTPSPHKDDDAYAVPDSPPPPRAPQREPHRSVTNSPALVSRKRSASEERKERQPPAASLPSPSKNKALHTPKRNEVSRLLNDLTEGSFMSVASKGSAGRRRTSEDSKKVKKEAKQHKLLRQLSDVSSSESEDESVGRGREKERGGRKGGGGSDSNSDQSQESVKARKKAKLVKEKTSPKDAKLKMPPRKEKPVAVAPSAPPPPSEPTPYEDDVNQPCDMEQCVRPRDDTVNWIQCDYCDKWYHSICIFGSSSLPRLSKKFDCGCVKDTKKQKKKRRKSDD